MKASTLLIATLAIVFALQPVVAYVAHHDYEECDDKAVHFFAAMHFRASRQQQVAFDMMLRPFVQAHATDYRWERTAFRLRSAGTYPLANLAIPMFFDPERPYTEVVNRGLLVVTVLGVIVVALVGSATPFGLWRTLVVLNIIAFDVVPGTFLIGQVPLNMHPFLAQVPRGAGALLVIAVTLSFADRRWLLSAACVLLVFLWHTGLGLLVAGVTISGGILYWCATRFRLMQRPWFYCIFAVGLVFGPSMLLHTGIIGVSIFLHSRCAGTRKADFFDRAFLSSLFVLFVSITASATVAVDQIGQFLQSVTGLYIATEVPQRLSGVEYAILALCVVLAGQFLLDLIMRQTGGLTAPHRHVPATVPAVLILGALAVFNYSSYMRLYTKDSGFFRDFCQSARVLQLPRDLSLLSLEDEPTLFLSFGHYLIDQRNR